MRTLLAAVVLALALAPPAAAQDATQEELEYVGAVWMVVTFVLIVLGAAAMWWVNHLYHPPGEKVRRKSRND